MCNKTKKMPKIEMECQKQFRISFPRVLSILQNSVFLMFLHSVSLWCFPKDSGKFPLTFSAFFFPFSVSVLQVFPPSHSVIFFYF